MASEHFNEAEQVFLARMAIHMVAGMSFDDAARAVCADDRRIVAAVQKKEAAPFRRHLSRRVFAAVHQSAA